MSGSDPGECTSGRISGEGTCGEGAGGGGGVLDTSGEVPGDASKDGSLSSDTLWLAILALFAMSPV